MSEDSIIVAAIAAIGNQRQIGKDNKLLWHIPEDLERFKKLTAGKAVIMGRKTWDSLPESVCPLPNRENIVLTRDEDYQAVGAAIMNDINEAISYAKDWSEENGKDEIFIIGGAAIYQQALPKTEKLYLTLVDTDTEGDTFFPAYKDEFGEIWREEHDENNPSYTFINLKRK